MAAPDPRTVSDLRKLSDARTIFDTLTVREPRTVREPVTGPEPAPGPATMGYADPSLDPDTITRLDDRRRLVKLLAGIGALIAVLIVVPLFVSEVEWPWSDPPSKPPPQWVTLPTLRATTADGSGIKARVAIDVDNSHTKSTIQSRQQQVAVMLEVTMASQGRTKLTSPEGMQRLATDMRERLNGYLAAEGVPAAKSVAIQDLVVSAP